MINVILRLVCEPAAVHVLLQIQFSDASVPWGENIREQDEIVNEPPYYPRPRIKRQTDEVVIRLRHLPPNSQVVVQVRILNKYYAGPPSEQITFHTLEGGESAATAPCWRCVIMSVCTVVCTCTCRLKDSYQKDSDISSSSIYCCRFIFMFCSAFFSSSRNSETAAVADESLPVFFNKWAIKCF